MPAGRPRKDLDHKILRGLAEIQCTMIEIASVLNVSVDTLERNYADIIRQGKERGKSSLRRAQYKKAMEGHPAMLIWLGKHYLDQKDTVNLQSMSAEPDVRRLLQRWDGDKVAETLTVIPKKVIREKEEGATEKGLQG